MAQTAILVTGPHWIIQVIHLLLAIAAIGLGEASVARFKRGEVAAPPAVNKAGD
jgi:hypothetical protein